MAMINAEAKCIHDGEEIKLRKKDSHALGLLCYAESELQNRMADYCAEFTGEDASILDQVHGEIAAHTCAVVFDELADIINDIASAMIHDAEAKKKAKCF